MAGCDKLHQGKQGLASLFFCRAHRKIYNDVGEGCVVWVVAGEGGGGGAGCVV